MVTDNLIEFLYSKEYRNLDRLLSPDVINQVDSDGRSLLVHAVLDTNADSELVEFLLMKGADPNLQDKEQKWTPLHFAARDQKLSIVKLLLQYGADIDRVDTFGNTPLWRCIMAPNVNEEVVHFLIENGADLNKKNTHGKSPLDISNAKGRSDLISS